jgi:hypothetical protein
MLLMGACRVWIGAVDIFAFNGDELYERAGSDESLKRAIGKLYLQCFINEVGVLSSTCTSAGVCGAETCNHRQVKRGERLIKPLFEAMRSGLHRVIPNESQHTSLPEEGARHDGQPMAEESGQDFKQPDYSVRESAVVPISSTPDNFPATDQRESEAEIDSSDDDGRRGDDEGILEPAADAVARDAKLEAFPRRLATGYHSLHRRRLQTEHSILPLKDAEARVTSTAEEALTRSAILKKYGDRVSHRYALPVVRVPWGVVDELEAERIRWSSEKGLLDKHIVQRVLSTVQKSPVRGKSGPEGQGTE